jgi:hypothetical protein
LYADGYYLDFIRRECCLSGLAGEDYGRTVPLACYDRLRDGLRLGIRLYAVVLLFEVVAAIVIRRVVITSFFFFFPYFPFPLAFFGLV